MSSNRKNLGLFRLKCEYRYKAFDYYHSIGNTFSFLHFFLQLQGKNGTE